MLVLFTLAGSAGYAQSSDSVRTERPTISPVFPGGDEGMKKYLSKELRYPKADIDNKVGGRVVVQFVVDTLGKVGDVKVIQSVSPTLDAEAVRVVSAMPLWKPGRNDGKLIQVQCTLPIRFNVENYVQNQQQGLKSAEKWGIVIGSIAGAVLGYMLVSYLF